MVTRKMVVSSDFAMNGGLGSNSGVRAVETRGVDGANGVVWRNGEQTHYYQHTSIGSRQPTGFTETMNQSIQPFSHVWGNNWSSFPVSNGPNPYGPNSYQMNDAGSYGVPQQQPSVSLPFAVPSFLHTKATVANGFAPPNFATTTTPIPNLPNAMSTAPAYQQHWQQPIPNWHPS